MRSQTPQAVESCHKLLLWLIPHLDAFPRNLGERLERRVDSPCPRVKSLPNPQRMHP